MISQNQPFTSDFGKWRFCVAPMLDWTDEGQKDEALQRVDLQQRLMLDRMLYRLIATRCFPRWF